MNLSKTGKLIAALRLEHGFTQKQIAEKLSISPKTVSKWERGQGFPDVCFLASLSEMFGVDVKKLLAGELPKTKAEAGNMKKTKFYVCDVCGNFVTDMGGSKQTEVFCCGRKLSQLLPQTPDVAHELQFDRLEDEYYITFSHPMTKAHYISFVSYVRFDRVLTVKLYPEQDAALRFPSMRGGKFYYYCNEHGLFELKK